MKNFDLIYFAYSVVPSYEANSIAVVNQCNSLNKHCKVLLVCIESSGLRDFSLSEFYGLDCEFKVLLLPWFVLKGNSFLYGLLAVLLCFLLRPRVVYSRDIFVSKALIFARITHIYELHQLDHPNEFFDSDFKRILRRIKDSQWLSTIVCVSNYLRSECLDFGIDRKKIWVLHSGCVIAETRQSLPKSICTTLTIMYAGSLQKGKGVEMIRSLAVRMPACRFVIIGGKPGNDRCSPANLIHKQRVVPGRIKNELADADIFLLPHTFEQFKFHSPLKLFEYLSLGRPVIASDIYGIKEIITHNENGLLAEPGDIDEWVNSLQLLISNENLYQRLCQNALQTAQSYTWDKRACLILELY